MTKYRICSGCNQKLLISNKNFYRYNDGYYTRCKSCVKIYREKYYNTIKAGPEYKICKVCNIMYENTSINFFRHRRRMGGLYEICKTCETNRRLLKYENTKYTLTIKKCNSCNRNLDIKNFDIDKYTKDGYKYKCKKCNKKYTNTEYNKIRDSKRRQYRELHDITYKLRRRIRARIYMALKNNYKNTSTINLLGCSIVELKQYLENKFVLNMSWNNYGKWHIDHIIPCNNFNLNDETQQKKCFHYTNLQPLWAKDNISKGHA